MVWTCDEDWVMKCMEFKAEDQLGDQEHGGYANTCVYKLLWCSADLLVATLFLDNQNHPQ